MQQFGDGQCDYCEGCVVVLCGELVGYDIEGQVCVGVNQWQQWCGQQVVVIECVYVMYGGEGVGFEIGCMVEGKYFGVVGEQVISVGEEGGDQYLYCCVEQVC